VFASVPSVAASKYTVIDPGSLSSASSCIWSLCAVTLAGIAIAYTTVICLAKGKQVRQEQVVDGAKSCETALSECGPKPSRIEQPNSNRVPAHVAYVQGGAEAHDLGFRVLAVGLRTSGTAALVAFYLLYSQPRWFLAQSWAL
jgi:hypothetical protein